VSPNCTAAGLWLVFAVLATAAMAEENMRDYTCFQTGSGYAPEVDIGSDMAVVYGVDDSFADRAGSWRQKGYVVGMMTGIAWGGYDAYYGSGDQFKRNEVQTEKSGKLWMHGNSTTVGYNVPTPAYIEFIKQYIDPAIDASVHAVFLEEPEYWAVTGWSEAFKKEWQRFYGEPWQPPDSSVDAQYRASKLKYELYFNALQEVFRHVKRRAAEKGIRIECHVPTHSLINYAQWRIVSPESHLMDLQEMDGYIAQVWTGTARSRNLYRGVGKERTFETAFLEYGQALGMVRPTKRKVWFLADPVEDNPDRTWEDYKRNYECTIVASLMWPEVRHFEVMPWPGRIFKGTYLKAGADANASRRHGIPSDYASEVLAIINALNEMDQPDVRYQTGSRGIGVIVSDTLMFQRADPSPSDPALSSFYGLALPLLKNGIPVEVVQLENAPQPDSLARYHVLLLTYEGQKPLKPEYHEALDRWVRGGGALIFVEDGSDPYHAVREWWNDQGRNKEAKAYDDLFARLGVTPADCRQPVRVGEGCVRVLADKPSEIARRADGADTILSLLKEVYALRGEPLVTQNYLMLRRGPFIVAAVLDESQSDRPLRIMGSLVNLFDAALPVVTECILQPGQRALLYDLEWARKNDASAKVAAASARVTNERLEPGAFVFTTRGPVNTTANIRVLLPKPPRGVALEPEQPCEQTWDERSATLVLRFSNTAQNVTVRVAL